MHISVVPWDWDAIDGPLQSFGGMCSIMSSNPYCYGPPPATNALLSKMQYNLCFLQIITNASRSCCNCSFLFSTNTRCLRESGARWIFSTGILQERGSCPYGKHCSGPSSRDLYTTSKCTGFVFEMRLLAWTIAAVKDIFSLVFFALDASHSPPTLVLFFFG